MSQEKEKSVKDDEKRKDDPAAMHNGELDVRDLKEITGGYPGSRTWLDHPKLQ